MTDQLISLLSLYVDEQVVAADIDNWIALNIWDAPEIDRTLIDQVAVELAYLKDKLSDESDFRTRMAEILSPSIVDLPAEASSVATVETASANVTVTSADPGVTIDVRVAAQFAA